VTTTSGGLTHVDATGAARMVDVGAQAPTRRSARARAVVVMRPATREANLAGRMPKGDVVAVARVAGIQAAKATSSLIPMCHPLLITYAKVDVSPLGTERLTVDAEVSVLSYTGVEMEALTAAAIAALTVYDMCKAIDRDMSIEGLSLLEKSGGRSGHYLREFPEEAS
jgi:cyclic pyranopterin phosphate synthase